MKQKAILLIALLALVSLMIIPASAETLTGSLGSTTSTQKNMTNTGTFCAGIYQTTFVNLRVADLENVGGTVALIHEDEVGKNVSINAGAPASDTAPFVGHLDTSGGVHIVTGTFGYARRFNALGVEQPGYQWLQFNNDWNLTGAGKTGDHTIYIEFVNTWGVHYECSAFVAWDYSTMAWNNDVQTGAWMTAGENRITISQSTLSEYTATKPSGLGIAGTVGKTIGGTQYLSRIFIEDSSGNIITSDAVSNANNFTFNVDESQIYIKMLSGAGTWYNSSLLFTSAVPTVTPTPVPTIAPGYVRNTFVTIDGVNYNTIHGSNIMLRDVENSSWSNSTSDADGIFYIDTLPYHTINAYATYTVFANHYGDAELIGVETGISGMDYPIYMFPPGLDPGAGNINLYIPVVDRDTNFAIGSVGVQVELPTGAIIGDITGPGGDAAVFVVPNNTVIRARASKTGYGPITESFNSGEVSPKTKTLYMQKLVVTIAPTSTIPTMGITTAITVDPRTDVKKAEDAFSKWMNILGDVTDIAIGVVIIWLMWLTVYMITGGKIIDKIMKRGRR